MPAHPVHLATGVTATTTLTILTRQPIEQRDEGFRLALLVVTVIYSILPDIDHRRSRAALLLHFTTFLLLVWMVIWQPRQMRRATSLLVGSIIGLETYYRFFAKTGRRHRQFPHSISFLLLATLMLYLISGSGFLTLVGFVCCGLHLALDRHWKWL